MFLNQQNRNYLLATLITIISFSCKFSNEKNRIIEVDSKLSLEQIVRQKKAFIIKIDSLFNMHDKRFLKVYVKVLNPKRYLFINDLKKIPENYLATYNLYYNNSGKLVLFKEVQNSESGDFSNVYTYYFDENGKTSSFKITSSFFGSDCELEESTITEETVKYYNSDFKQIKTDYKIENENGKSIDTTRCIFNYRFNYNVYSSINSIPSLKEILNAYSK